MTLARNRWANVLWAIDTDPYFYLYFCSVLSSGGDNSVLCAIVVQALHGQSVEEDISDHVPPLTLQLLQAQVKVVVTVAVRLREAIVEDPIPVK